MTIREMMKYIESEYQIINSTPCEICGGNFIADSIGINIVNSFPFDVCHCICEDCGHKKTFKFSSPFVFSDEENLNAFKRDMN
ncbi:metal-binding protein [Haloimpatiens lingqiaonensis]|uniref:metal-binding protein n=1 Tax=Haloimpatiens lingqiaonensis TaxID=1380675 RepID=UPI0010FCDE7E|nr:metal-binding protein [Haloimpatiens lingqiaonensis]